MLFFFIFGIIVGIIIGVIIILGLIICIFCRVRRRYREKKRKLFVKGSGGFKLDVEVMEIMFVCDFGDFKIFISIGFGVKVKVKSFFIKFSRLEKLCIEF